MASTLPTILAILALLPTAFPTALPQAFTAPTGCGARLLLLTPCMPFVQGMAPAPSDACCGGLVNVYRNRPHCLCNLLDDSITIPIINITLAQRLPLICRLALPTNDHTCPGLSLPPVETPPVETPKSPDRENSTITPPATPTASSPPVPKANLLLLGLNGVEKMGVEGTFTAVAVILLLLAGTLYIVQI